MFIKLENYKQHDVIELSLPDKGLVLLKGKSGAGKTTIFKAIYDGLFMLSKSSKPWSGATKTSVEMHVCGIDIKMTRRPNTITVTRKDGVQFKGDAALAEIASTIGMSADEFMACSYVEQKFANSILDMEPKQIMMFLENISSRKIDPEDVKERLRRRIRDNQDKFSIAENTLMIADDNLAKLPEAVIEPVLPAEPVEGWQDLNPLCIELMIRNTNLWGKISVAENKLDATKRAKSMIKTAEAELLDAELNLQASLEPMSELEISEQNALTQKLIQKSEYFNVYDKLIAMAGTVHDKWPDAVSFKGKLSVFMEELQIAFQQESEYLSNKIGELNAAIENASKVLVCPSCGDNLVLNQDALQSVAEPVDMSVLSQEIIKYKQAQTSLAGEIKALVDIIHKVDNLKERIIDGDPAPEYKDRAAVQKEVDKINEQITQNTTNTKIYRELSGDLDWKRNKLNTLLLSIDDSVTEESLSELRNSHEVQERKIAEMQKTLELVNVFKVEKAKYDSDLRLYSSISKTIKDAHLAMKKACTAYDEANARLSASKRLKERVDVAASEAIESTVFLINDNASGYIDNMFAEDGTKIQLSNFATTQKGEERAKVGFEVFHKGVQTNSIKDFSGGELSRACLAFQLGLSDMYNSPILMIDEGFEGLDPELKAECLEVLKSAAEDKLIIVIEHGAPESFFDEVISV